MASEVNVPGAGKMSKKALVFILGGSAAVLGFLWYRHRSSANAAASTATTATDATNPAYDPNAIDPATGIPYADEYGTGIDPNTGLPYSQELAGGYYDPNTGQYVYGGSGGAGYIPPSVPTAAITTNAEWAQAAESYLTTNAGVDLTALSAAIGKYLTGQAMDSTQQGLVDQAIAFEGYPPVSGPNGFPPAMQTSPTGSGGGSGGGGSGGGGGPTGPPVGVTVTVPNVRGKSQAAADAAITRAGLVPHNKGGAGSGKPVNSQTPGAGKKVPTGTGVDLGFG